MGLCPRLAAVCGVVEKVGECRCARLTETLMYQVQTCNCFDSATNIRVTGVLLDPYIPCTALICITPTAAIRTRLGSVSRLRAAGSRSASLLPASLAPTPVSFPSFPCSRPAGCTLHQSLTVTTGLHSIE